nr:PREDICTED: U7 snRNA-associated Sm-like protein LSm10 [Struthio camelus australis]
MCVCKGRGGGMHTSVQGEECESMQGRCSAFLWWLHRSMCPGTQSLADLPLGERAVGQAGAGQGAAWRLLFLCYSGAMEVSHSVKERTIAENSLVILLQGLHGHVTTVDLRDESTATGRITNVDAFMNVRLSEVTFTDRQGTVSHLDELFITGRNVRYVHIPDEVDIRATIERQLQAIHRIRYFGGRDKGRKEFPRARHK